MIELEAPDKYDGNCIVENTLAKDKCIKVNVDVEVGEDGKHCHCNMISSSLQNTHIH